MFRCTGSAELCEFFQAKKNELAVEDMDGGTFTISNGGVFGSLMGTPIINPPQSAILGMHGIFERPVAIKGEVGVAASMFFVAFGREWPLDFPHGMGRQLALVVLSCFGRHSHDGSRTLESRSFL